MKEDTPLYQERIIADPRILAGKPVVKGTRISGSTQTGYGDSNHPVPGFDQDHYLIATAGIASVQPAAETDMPLSIAVYDPQTGEDLVCTGDTCTIPAGLSAVVLWIASQDAATYRVQVQAGGAGDPGVPSAGLMANPLYLNSGLRTCCSEPKTPEKAEGTPTSRLLFIRNTQGDDHLVDPVHRRFPLPFP